MNGQFIPNTIGEISPEWLTDALTSSGVLKNNAVHEVKTEIIGEDIGYVGILARLQIGYDKPDQTAPSTMIAKIPTLEKKNKMIMEAFWNYERENRLYEEVLDHLPVKTPRCYYSAFDPGLGEKTMSKVYQRYGTLPQGLMGLYFLYVAIRNLRLKRRYILLLEDLGHLEQIDQREGCSYEVAKQLMKTIGVAHAAYWENPQLGRFWLKDHTEFPNMMGFLSAKGIPVIKKLFAGKVSTKVNEVFSWLKMNNNSLDRYIQKRPTTLIHTDYRLDNIFFDHENNQVVLIDWQASCPGLGLFDPCFFILTNGNCPFTPEQGKELITVYHQGLVEGGLTDYSFEACMRDYPYGMLVALRYMLIIIGGLEIEKNPNARHMLNLWFDRMVPLIEDIDLPAL